MAKGQNLLFSQLLDEQIERIGRLAKEIAEQAGIAERTLSMLRHGTRRPSAETAQKLAKVLGADPAEFLLAAGFVPQSSAGRRSQFVEVLTLEDLVQEETRVPPQGAVWVISFALAELVHRELYQAVLENLKKKVSYVFFLSERNALNFLLLSDRLAHEGLPAETAKVECIILPDFSYPVRKPERLYTLLSVGEPTKLCCYERFVARGSEGVGYTQMHPESAQELQETFAERRAKAAQHAEQKSEIPILPATWEQYWPFLLKGLLARLEKGKGPD